MDLKSRVEFMDFAMEYLKHCEGGMRGQTTVPTLRSRRQHLYDERTHAMACIGIQEICLNKSNQTIAGQDDVLQMKLDFALS